MYLSRVISSNPGLGYSRITHSIIFLHTDTGNKLVILVCKQYLDQPCLPYNASYKLDAEPCIKILGTYFAFTVRREIPLVATSMPIGSASPGL
jgi:hypothetical protein